MRSTRSTRTKTVAASFPLFSDDMTDAGYYPDGRTESSIDALLEDVDRELAADEHVMTTRLRYSLTDARTARRTTRRVSRVALRSLPVQLGTSDLFEGEAA
jgi:hypothetical protein